LPTPFYGPRSGVDNQAFHYVDAIAEAYVENKAVSAVKAGFRRDVRISRSPPQRANVMATAGEAIGM